MNNKFFINALKFLIGTFLSVAPVFIATYFFAQRNSMTCMWITITSLIPPIITYKYIFRPLYNENRTPLFFIIINFCAANYMFLQG